MKIVLVAAAALIKAVDAQPRRVLLAQRPRGKEMELLWEFPGGKIEENEIPAQALVRELREELAIDVDVNQLTPLTFVSHTYTTGVKKPFHLLMLVFSCINGWKGEPMGAEGQAFSWVAAEELNNFEYPAADLPLLPAVRELLGQPEVQMS